MSENWKDVVGYEGYYQVSSLGGVRSLDRTVFHSRMGPTRRRGKRLCSFPLDRYGHLAVTLCKDGYRRKVYVHRLVARAWIGPCPIGQQVRHGCNGKLDNSVSNLSYGTEQDQQRDRRRDGTHGGRSVRRSDGVEFINMHVAAEETGSCVSSICKVCRGRLQTTNGYGWEYL